MKHFLKELCKDFLFALDIFLCCDVSDVGLLVLCDISLCTSVAELVESFATVIPFVGKLYTYITLDRVFITLYYVSSVYQ